jgi:hypothetical protein
MAEIKNGVVTIEGLDALEDKLKRMKTDDPTFEKRLRGAIRQIMTEARKDLSGNAQTGLKMENDPRHAYKAVRYAIYKRIFGGQVNILQSRKASAGSLYKPPRTLDPSKRGGNRRLRSQRTEQLMSYRGKDRGFILRFLNNGMTKNNPRTIQFTEDSRRKVDKWNKHPNTGNRGAISARNWFGSASQRELNQAAEKLQAIIDRIINDEFV